jgi:hypothetical protein
MIQKTNNSKLVAEMLTFSFSLVENLVPGTAFYDVVKSAVRIEIERLFSVDVYAGGDRFSSFCFFGFPVFQYGRD